MPKPWDEVREYVCSLYGQGTPLSKVKEVLQQEHGFEASTRAYRLKLGEWGARRIDSRCCNRQTSLNAESEAIAYGDPLKISKFSCETVSVQNGQCQDSADSTSRTPNSSIGLEELYERISKATSVEEQLLALHSSSFEKDKDHILHFAAKRNNKAVLCSAIAFVRMKQVSIDSPSSKGRSPLEIAILAGSIQNVEILVEAGASVRARSQRGEQPLHLAIGSRASWMICKLLLEKGADANAACFLRGSILTALQMAVQTRQTLCAAELENYIQTVQLLFQFGANVDCLDNARNEVFHYFLSTVSRSPIHEDNLLQLIHDGLRLFLQRSCDPFIPVAIAYCPTGYCKTLATSMLFHTPYTILHSALVKNCSVELFGQKLLYAMLQPCDKSCSCELVLWVDDLVRHLLSRGVQINMCLNPICYVLANSPAQLKADFIKLLVLHRVGDTHAEDQTYGRPLEVLTTVEEPLRWHLAEIMLARDYDLATAKHSQQTRRQHLSHLFPFGTGSAFILYSDPKFKDSLKAYFSLRESDPVAENQIDIAARCIIHVLTKRRIDHLILSDDLAMCKAELVNALDMRRDFQLPDIYLNNRMVIDALLVDSSPPFMDEALNPEDSDMVFDYLDDVECVRTVTIPVKVSAGAAHEVCESADIWGDSNNALRLVASKGLVSCNCTNLEVRPI